MEAKFKGLRDFQSGEKEEGDAGLNLGVRMLVLLTEMMK